MLENYTIEIASAIPPPIKLAMCDSINCPVCETDLSNELSIDLQTFAVDDNSVIYCENCDVNITFKIKRC